MKRLLVELGARVPATRWWRVNAGTVVLFDASGNRRAFHGAPTGAADLAGIAGPGGWHVHVETKSSEGTQTTEQRAWQAMIERHGGLYLLCPYDDAQPMAANLATAVARVAAKIDLKRVGPQAAPQDSP